MPRGAAISAVWLAAPLLVACPSSYTSTWMTDLAEERRAEGRPEAALRRSERAVQVHYDDPHEGLVAVHAAALRDLGRDAEAAAFVDFVRRYEAGEDTYATDTTPSWRVCTGRQFGAGLIRGWGNFGHLLRDGGYPIGTIAATFAIEESGEISNIRVLRAKHPGAAWLIIDAVGGIVVSEEALRRFRDRHPDAFPVPLCVWWNYDRIDEQIRAGQGIFGFR